jgi:hypothetical protein
MRGLSSWKLFKTNLFLLMLSLAIWSCSDTKPQGTTPVRNPDPAAAAAAENEKSLGKAVDGSKTSTPNGTGPKSSSDLDPSKAPIPAGPTSMPVAVQNGPIVFDLSGPRPALQGAQVSAEVTINAAAPGVPPSVTLQRIAVKGSSATGFLIYRPVVVTQKAGGAEELLQIGTDINQKVAKGRMVPLAQDFITISGVQAGDTIRLRFSALEPLANTENMGIPNYRECKAPQNFQAMASALVPCKSCHGGLFNYDFQEKDLATACGLNLKLIDLSLNPSGKLPNLQRPLMGGHPATNTSTYNQSLSTWRSGEGL